MEAAFRRERGGRSLTQQSWRRLEEGLGSAGITFNVQVCGGFIGAAVAGVRSHVAFRRLLDNQQALLPVRLELNILGRIDLFSVLEPFHFTAGLAQLTGQDHLVLLDCGVVLEFGCEVEVALCKQTPAITSSRQQTKDTAQRQPFTTGTCPFEKLLCKGKK